MQVADPSPPCPITWSRSDAASQSQQGIHESQPFDAWRAERNRIADANDIATPSPLGEERAHCGAQVGARPTGTLLPGEELVEARPALDGHGDVPQFLRIGGAGVRSCKPPVLVEPSEHGVGQLSGATQHEPDEAGDVRSRGRATRHRRLDPEADSAQRQQLSNHQTLSSSRLLVRASAPKPRSPPSRHRRRPFRSVWARCISAVLRRRAPTPAPSRGSHSAE